MCTTTVCIVRIRSTRILCAYDLLAAFWLHWTIPTKWCTLYSIHVDAMVLHHMMYSFFRCSFCTVTVTLHIKLHTSHSSIHQSSSIYTHISLKQTIVHSIKRPKRKTFTRHASGSSSKTIISINIKLYIDGVCVLISLNGTVDELASQMLLVPLILFCFSVFFIRYTQKIKNRICEKGWKSSLNI